MTDFTTQRGEVLAEWFAGSVSSAAAQLVRIPVSVARTSQR